MYKYRGRQPAGKTEAAEANSSKSKLHQTFPQRYQNTAKSSQGLSAYLILFPNALTLNRRRHLRPTLPLYSSHRTPRRINMCQQRYRSSQQPAEEGSAACEPILLVLPPHLDTHSKHCDCDAAENDHIHWLLNNCDYYEKYLGGGFR